MTLPAPAARSSGLPPALAPLPAGRRIPSLDILRGFALLGILFINVQSFSMIGAAYFNPTAQMDLTGANRLVWLLGHLLADQKFMTVFSMLFGAGIVLMARRAESAGRSALGPHCRRMLWLILFGLLHAYLLWYGDVLYTYGLCGLVAFPFRKLRPGWLLALGLLSLGVCSSLWLLSQWSMQSWDARQLAEFARNWQPDAAAVAEEVATYRGGWVTQMAERIPAALEMQVYVFPFWSAWRAGGLMLIGMALYKLGLFSAGRSSRFYAVLLAVGALAGLPLVGFGVYWNDAHGWSARHSFFGGTQFNFWGSIAVSLAWVGAIQLLCRAGRPAGLLSRLAAVGRMALSLYILQTLAGTLIFYGHGLGLFGRVERVGQIAIVLALTLLQLWLAPLWLRRFRFGPLEWLWRSLTYLHRQPMRD
jgi:uncharacterized protein